MFLGEAEDADRATDEDIPGTDVKFHVIIIIIILINHGHAHVT